MNAFCNIIACSVLQLFTVFQVDVSGYVCPAGWLLYRTQCYFVDAGGPMGYDDAVGACNGLDAQLTAVETVDEHQFLQHYLTDNYASGQDQFWTSLFSPLGGDIEDFAWTNGCKLTYDCWILNEPSEGDVPVRVCARYSRMDSPVYGMSDTKSCSEVYGYICETNAQRVTPAGQMDTSFARRLYPSSNLKIQAETAARCMFECNVWCTHDVSCESFAYNTDTGMCRMLASSCDGSPLHADGAGWTTYYI